MNKMYLWFLSLTGLQKQAQANNKNNYSLVLLIIISCTTTLVGVSLIICTIKLLYNARKKKMVSTSVFAPVQIKALFIKPISLLLFLCG